MEKTALLSLMLAALGQAAAGSAGSDSPENAIRGFYRAILGGDASAYHAIIVADPRADRFLPREKPSPDKVHEIDMASRDFRLRQLQPFRLKGLGVPPDPKIGYPIGTTTRFLGNFPQSLTVVSVVRTADGWKVDMRWWEAIADLTEEGPVKGTPEYTVKALTASLVSLRRDMAKQLITPPTEVETVFAGAPDSPEPSDQLMSLVGEMPVVEARPGEFFPLPSGRVVEGVESPDQKLLVGLFGPREITFLLQRVNGEWRVTAEPYFDVLTW